MTIKFIIVIVSITSVAIYQLGKIVTIYAERKRQTRWYGFYMCFTMGVGLILNQLLTHYTK